MGNRVEGKRDEKRRRGRYKSQRKRDGDQEK